MPSSTPIQLPADLVRRLRAFRRQVRIVKMLEAVCLTGIFIILSYILLYLSDRLWETPSIVSRLLFLTAIVGLILFIPLWWKRWIWQHRTEAQLARLISRKTPSIGDKLLGIIELDSEKQEHSFSSEKLKQAAIKQVAQEVSTLDLSVNIPHSYHKKLFILLVALALGSTLTYIISPEAAENALDRWIHPFNPPERYTFTQLEATPDSLIIPMGESYLYKIRTANNTKSQPQTAEYVFRHGGKHQITLTDGIYPINLPPMQQTDELTFFAGDAVRQITIIPKPRPSLVKAAADINYPSYMARSTGQESMKAGIISAPEGSELTVKVTASEHLQSAVGEQGKLLRVENNDVIIPNIQLGTTTKELEINWIDKNGLKTTQPIKIHLEPVEDKEPSIYLRGREDERHILEDTSIELELEASDDFGIRELGVDWQGEQSFYTDKEETNEKNAPLETSKPQKGVRGEKVLAKGAPTQTSLKRTYLFSPKALKLPPQRVILRGFTQDYKPDHKRIYSEPIVIFILSKSEHAQMIRNELDRISAEMEGMTRRMDTMTDEAERLKRLKIDELQNAANQDRLHTLADEEQTNRRELNDLLHRSEDLFKEAAKNPQIDPAGMKEFMKGISMLKPIPDGTMKKAQKQFREAASGQDNSKALEDGERFHKEATQALKNTIQQLSKSAQDMEASTFVARLKQAASKEDSIANALVNQLGLIVGMTMEELDPAMKRELETIATLQNVSTQNIGWILEDLNYYKSRTKEQIYSDLYNQMNAFSLREKLDLVHGNILNAITARSIDESRLYATTLRHWAKLIDDFKKERNNSGGGSNGGGNEEASISDADFEFMLKIIRMIQQEQDIRMRTRAAEQERRNALTTPTL